MGSEKLREEDILECSPLGEPSKDFFIKNNLSGSSSTTDSPTYKSCEY